MTRKLVADDFLKMPHARILGYWIMLGSDEQNQINSAVEAEKIIASFDAYGREAVASILGEAGYLTEDKGVQEIVLLDAIQTLTSLQRNRDYRLFNVGFIKREDQSFRKMTCRYGVRKFIKGKGKPFEDGEYNLTTVWDVNAPPKYTLTEQNILNGSDFEAAAKIVKPKGGYRSISLEGLITMKIGGQEYIITENKDLVHKLSLE